MVRSFASVSLDPPLVLDSIAKSSAFHDVFKNAAANGGTSRVRGHLNPGSEVPLAGTGKVASGVRRGRRGS